MEFLDTPEPSAAPGQQHQHAPHSAVRFEPDGAAATPDGAEVGRVAPDAPLLGAAPRPSLAEGAPSAALALQKNRQPISCLNRRHARFARTWQLYASRLFVSGAVSW